MKNILLIIAGVVAFCALMWGMYWVVKTGSYFFFYESMVHETVREMVKPEYLR